MSRNNVITKRMKYNTSEPEYEVIQTNCITDSNVKMDVNPAYQATS